MIKFDTTKYEKVHGKKPRGQWFWAFNIGPEDGEEEPTPALIPGRYHEVKRRVAEHAKQLGEDEITVLP